MGLLNFRGKPAVDPQGIPLKPLDQMPEFQARDTGSGSFSMIVEDVFTITGRGTVATGQIARGTVHKGDHAVIHTPDGDFPTVIQGVELFRRIVDQAQAGDNVGLLLDGVVHQQVSRDCVIEGSA